MTDFRDDVGDENKMRMADTERLKDVQQKTNMNLLLDKVDKASTMRPDTAPVHRIPAAITKAETILKKMIVANNPQMIDKDIITEVILTNHSRFRGCLSLPVILIFFIFYSGSMITHKDTVSSYLVQAPFVAAFRPELEEITNLDGVWNFLTNTYVPTMFGNSSADDENGATGAGQRIFGFGVLQGNVVMELQRSKRQNCKDKYAEHLACYPQDDLDDAPFGRDWADPTWTVPGGGSPQEYFATALNGNFDEGFVMGSSRRLLATSPRAKGRRLPILREELDRYMPPEDPDKVFSFHLDPMDNVNITSQRVQYLQQRGWLDVRTTQMVVSALVLNPEFGRSRLESVDIWFYLQRGGGVYAKYRTNALLLDVFSGAWNYFFDIIFCLSLLAATAGIIIELIYSCKHPNGFVRHYFTAVNIMAIASASMGWVNLGLLFWETTLVSDLREKLEAYNAAILAGIGATEASDALHVTAEDMVAATTLSRVFVAMAYIVIVARIFLAVEYQPRLGMVIKTLGKTTVDLAHFLIVLIPTFVGFAIAGCQIFGRRLREFSTLQASIGTCFKIAMEAEFDWARLSEEDLVTSMIWVWMFVLLVVILLLNMVLVIIMDVYSVVRVEGFAAETVWANAWFLAKRVYFWKLWIPDDVLLSRINKLPDVFIVQDLLKAVPGLQQAQLSRLLDGCAVKGATFLKTRIDSKHTSQIVCALQVALDSVLDDLHTLRETGFIGPHFSTGSLPLRKQVEDILHSIVAQRHWMDLLDQQVASLSAKF
mmetsp:Transcript_43017/g.98883  ORF Transcript_43017/g.98883 Transcript_43017/m.98883 type:complete len:768 (-) Transcript_43017:81-2384(-)